MYTYTYTHMHVHIHTHTCIHICIHTHIHVYIYIHIHIHTYMDTYTYTYAHTCTYTYIYIHMSMHTYIYIYIYIYRIRTSCREREANVYADVHNICLTYMPAHAWCATTLVNACRLSAKKMHMYSCMRAYSTLQQLLCHGGYCELILSLARTSCRLLFTACPTARPLAGNPLRGVVRSRNPSKIHASS